MNDREFNNRPWPVPVYSEAYSELASMQSRRSVIHRNGVRYVRDTQHDIRGNSESNHQSETQDGSHPKHGRGKQGGVLR